MILLKSTESGGLMLKNSQVRPLGNLVRMTWSSALGFINFGSCVHNTDHEVGPICLQHGKILNRAQRDCSMVKNR